MGGGEANKGRVAAKKTTWMCPRGVQLSSSGEFWSSLSERLGSAASGTSLELDPPLGIPFLSLARKAPLLAPAALKSPIQSSPFYLGCAVMLGSGGG